MPTLETSHGKAQIIGKRVDGGLALMFPLAGASPELSGQYSRGGPCFTVLTSWGYCEVCMTQTQHVKLSGNSECLEHPSERRNGDG